MSWRRLRTLMKREARATMRDPFTMTILVAVPLVALTLFGFVLSTEVKGLRLGVHDASGSAVGRRIQADLAAGDAFRPVPFATREALDRALVSGEIRAALVLPPGLAREVDGGGSPDSAAQVQVIYDGAESLLSSNAEGYLRSLVAASLADVAANDALPDRAAPSLTAGRGIRLSTRALFNPRLDGQRYMVAGTFGFVLSFLTTLITAVSIVNERLGGTFEQLQVTPATSLEIFLGKILPLGAVFAGDVALMVLVAGLALGVWPVGSAALFVGISSFYVLVSLALGIVISATSKTAPEAVQKTVMLSIPLTQLSGFAFPLRSLPRPVQWFAEAFPATHYIRISRAIYLRGQGFESMIGELALLVLFAALLIAVALRTMDQRT